MEDEGYIAASRRKGYFVLTVRALKPRYLGENEKLNLLALPQPQRMRDFQYSLWIKTTRKVLSEQQDRLFVKAPAKGCEVLRNAIAEYLLHYRGYLAQPERIVIGSGAEQLYENIVKLLGREKIYAVENPSYAKIQAVYREMGAEVRLLPISDDGIDGDVLQKSGANVLHVTPYRSFPSGITTSAAKKFEYLALGGKNRRVYRGGRLRQRILSARAAARTVDGARRLAAGNLYQHFFQKPVAVASHRIYDSA